MVEDDAVESIGLKPLGNADVALGEAVCMLVRTAVETVGILVEYDGASLGENVWYVGRSVEYVGELLGIPVAYVGTCVSCAKSVFRRRKEAELRDAVK